MDMKKNVTDVSRFFLFEATGDSADVVMGGDDDDIGQDNAMADDDDDDDDAESCSYDSHGVRELFDSNVKSCVHDEYDNDEGVEDDDDDDEDEGNSYQTMAGREHMEKQRGRLQKSSVSVDSSSKELMNEAEKSKRFWEACLAS